MRINGTDLANTLGNVEMRFGAMDINTGANPAPAAGVNAPSQRPLPGYNPN